MSLAPLVEVTRGGRLESLHYGAVAVVNAKGDLLYHAGDPDFLAAKRSGLRARMQRSPLMDERGYTRALEAGYRAAWWRRCDGLPAAAMALETAS